MLLYSTMRKAGWVTSILLWIAIVIDAIVWLTQLSEYAAFRVILTDGLWLCYMIVEVSCWYLDPQSNQKDMKNVHDYLHQLFNAEPDVLWRSESVQVEQNLEPQGENTSKPNGPEPLTLKPTLGTTKRFMCRSWRDISGSFALKNIRKQRREELAFIELHLSLEVTFAQDGTREEYEAEYRKFQDCERERDAECRFTSEMKLDGLQSHIVVSVPSYNPPYYQTNLCYWLCLIFTVVELYKPYSCGVTVPQEFTIKKIVSNHADLHDAESSALYASQKPSVDIFRDIQNDSPPIISDYYAAGSKDPSDTPLETLEMREALLPNT